MFEPFIEPLTIIETLQKHGHEAYFVGGAVRDYLLNRPIGDVDIATSALPSDVIGLFPKTIDVGVEHGTVIVMINNTQYEVTTFRSEGEYEDNRRPSTVSFISSLHEDLKRRDFTINAIAMDCTGQILDPFNGQDAIRNGRIETVGEPSERFNEDALRMMRGIRFVSQLSFSLSSKTLEAMKQHASLMRKISIERKTVEFEKLMKGPNCSEAYRMLKDTLLYKYLPGLDGYDEQIDTLQGYSWTSLEKRTEYWALLLFLLNHQNVQSFLKSWKLPNKVIAATDKIVNALRQVLLKGWNQELLFQLGLDYSIQVERVRSVITKENVKANVEQIQQQFSYLPIQSREDLVINGNDLIEWYEKKPGPWISSMIATIERSVLNQEVQNDRNAIKEWLFHCKQK